jgi:hypothetical protein
VDEYVLIGECDDGQCGDNWATWGNPHFLDDDDDAQQAEGVGMSNQGDSSAEDAATTTSRPPPFEADGYERVDLDFLAPHQFSRYDSRVSKSGRTVSFRRRAAAAGETST